MIWRMTDRMFFVIAVTAGCMMPTMVRSEDPVFTLRNADDCERINAFLVDSKGEFAYTILATEYGKAELCRWNLKTGDEERVVELEEYHSHDVNIPTYLSADEKSILFYRKSATHSFLEQTDLSTGEELRSIRVGSLHQKENYPFRMTPAECFAATDDFSRAAVQFGRGESREKGPDSLIRIYDLDTGNVSRELEPHQLDKKRVREKVFATADFSFSPKGNKLATVGSDKNRLSVLRIWDLESGKLLAEAQVPNHELNWEKSKECYAFFVGWLDDARLAVMSWGLKDEDQDDSRHVTLLGQIWGLDEAGGLSERNHWMNVSGFGGTCFRSDGYVEKGVAQLSGDRLSFALFDYAYGGLQLIELSTGRSLINPRTIRTMLSEGDPTQHPTNLAAIAPAYDGKHVWCLDCRSEVRVLSVPWERSLRR